MTFNFNLIILSELVLLLLLIIIFSLLCFLSVSISNISPSSMLINALLYYFNHFIYMTN